MTWEIREGDVLDRLREMPDESVHCVVTSPPYWGLRDYGTAEWDGGDAACDHAAARRKTRYDYDAVAGMYADECPTCGARSIDRQIGLEPTPSAYLARMVEVFREVRRVLRSDGTCWVNMGDSYAATTKGSGGHSEKQDSNEGSWFGDGSWSIPPGLKPKDLIGMPWRLAFALQDDGWWLRSEIIWAKPNPMPESVTDRPTKAHEQIFLLTKSARYFYDADAIREESITNDPRRPYTSKGAWDLDGRPESQRHGGELRTTNVSGRNARTVWTIATQPFPEAHFATFPEELPRRCILAGTSERGVCPDCGAPWLRVVEREGEWRAQHDRIAKHDGTIYRVNPGGGVLGPNTPRRRTTIGWEATCAHALDPVPATVLDPFAGSGTTLMVAVRHGRSALGIELNPEYAEMARRRIVADAPLFNAPVLPMEVTR